MTTTKGAPVATLADILPSETAMVRNILKVYRSATDAQRGQGMAWYDEAHSLAVALDPENPMRAAGVISALSPRIQWSYNQKLAIRLYADGVLTGGCLPANYTKANKIFNGADVMATLKAPKTQAFAATIANPAGDHAPVIDRHAFSVAVGYASTDDDTSILGRKGAYDLFAGAYRKAAKRAGISPSQMQAVTWVVWRQTAIRYSASILREETVAA
jgi:hypothetical protein